MQFFMMSLADNLKTHFKMNTLNFSSILEEQQKRYLNDFKTKKNEELKMMLDDEMWNHQQVSPFFQRIVNKINSIELFEEKEEESKEDNSEMSDYLCTPDCEYKVVNSLMKFMHMVYEFLKIIRSFP